MKYKFQIGDRVQIRGDLKLRQYSMENGRRSAGAVSSMLRYAGQEAVIKGYSNTGKYLLDIDDGFYVWTDGMLEELFVSIDEEQLKKSLDSLL